MNIIDDRKNEIFGNSQYLSELDEFDIEMESYYINDSNSYIINVINEFDYVEESIVDKVKEKGGNVINKVKELWKKFKAWVKNLVRVVTNMFLSGEKIVKKYGSQIKTEYARKKNTLSVKSYIYDVNIGEIDTMVNKLITDESHRNNTVSQDQGDFNNSVIKCIRNDKEVDILSQIPLNNIINLLSNGKSFIKSIKNMEKKVDGQFKELINKLNKAEDGDAEVLSNAKKMSSMTSKMFNGLIREIKSGVRSYTSIVRKLLNDKYKGEDGEIEEDNDVKDYVEDRKNSITPEDRQKSNDKLNEAQKAETEKMNKEFDEREKQLTDEMKKTAKDNVEDIKKTLKGLDVSEKVIKDMANSSSKLEFYDNLINNKSFAYLDKESQDFYYKAQEEETKKFKEYQKAFKDAVKEAEDKEKEKNVKDQSDYLADMKEKAKNRKNFDEEKFQQMLNDDSKDEKVNKEDLEALINKFNKQSKVHSGGNSSKIKNYVNKQEQSLKSKQDSNAPKANKGKGEDWYKKGEDSIRERFKMSEEEFKKFKSNPENNKLIGDIVNLRNDAWEVTEQRNKEDRYLDDDTKNEFVGAGRKKNPERERLNNKIDEIHKKIKEKEDRLRLKTGFSHIVNDENKKRIADEDEKEKLNKLNKKIKDSKSKNKERREYIQSGREKIKKGKNQWK